eukprot:7920397-Alexandrium_andersonii.AAC.1
MQTSNPGIKVSAGAFRPNAAMNSVWVRRVWRCKAVAPKSSKGGPTPLLTARQRWHTSRVL